MRTALTRAASACRWALPWLFLASAFGLVAYYAVRLLGPHAAQAPYFDIIGRPRGHEVLSGIFVAAVFASSIKVVPFVLSHAAAWKRLSVLVLFGFALQWAFFASDGRGFTLMHERLWDRGAPPAEFIGIAKDPLPDDLVSRYDAIGEEKNWHYSRMKGPALLWVYRGIVKVSNGPVGRALGGVVAKGPEASADDRITGVIFVAFPLFTFLTVVPLFLLARALANERVAGVAALFFVLTPSAGIVVMHLDGALYPLVTTASAAIVAIGMRRTWPVFVAGVLLSAECLASFSPLPEIGAIGLFLGLFTLLEPDVPIVTRVMNAALRGALFTAGLVSMHALLALVAHYHPIDRLHICLTRYDAWEPPDRSLCKYYNFLQFLMWFGPALGALVLAEMVHLATTKERTSARAMWLLAILAAMIYSTLHLTGEVMRLWLPMMPLLAPVAAASFVRLRDAGRPWLLPLVAIGQVFTTFVLMYRYEP